MCMNMLHLTAIEFWMVNKYTCILLFNIQLLCQIFNLNSSHLCLDFSQVHHFGAYSWSMVVNLDGTKSIFLIFYHEKLPVYKDNTCVIIFLNFYHKTGPKICRLYFIYIASWQCTKKLPVWMIDELGLTVSDIAQVYEHLSCYLFVLNSHIYNTIWSLKII